jgi:UDP-N-acetylmuramate-alanine ligase
VVRLLGARLAMNAALAWAGAVSLGADPDGAAEGLGRIGVIWRRLELLGSRDGVSIVDDFGGKHPASVRAGIEALRSYFPGASITAVLEPCGHFMARWGHRYAQALGAADRVVVVPAFFHPDYERGGAFDDRWAGACRVAPTYVDDHAAAAATAMRISRPGDVVVFFSQRASSRVMAESALAGVSR